MIVCCMFQIKITQKHETWKTTRKLFSHCILGNFSCFLSSADFFFQNKLLEKKKSGIPSEHQTVWTLIRPNGPNCLPRLSEDGTGRQGVN